MKNKITSSTRNTFHPNSFIYIIYRVPLVEQELLALRSTCFHLRFVWGSSCCSLLSFLCNVLQIVVCPFCFCHCALCPSSISGFWLTHLQLETMRIAKEKLDIISMHPLQQTTHSIQVLINIHCILFLSYIPYATNSTSEYFIIHSFHHNTLNSFRHMAQEFHVIAPTCGELNRLMYFNPILIFGPSMAIEINKQCKPGTDLIHLKDTTHCQNMNDNIKMDSIITVIECSYLPGYLRVRQNILVKDYQC